MKKKRTNLAKDKKKSTPLQEALDAVTEYTGEDSAAHKSQKDGDKAEYLDILMKMKPENNKKMM